MMRITVLFTSLLLVATCGKSDAPETSAQNPAAAPPPVTSKASAPQLPAAASTQLVLTAEAARGRDVFEYWCATCHGPGPHKAGTMALGFKYNGELPASLLERSDIDEAMLTYFIRNGISVMPSFRPTEVSDADIAAMAAYIAETSRAAE